MTMPTGRVLVTGASGFIGQALCRHLLDAGYTVRALGRNLAGLQNLAQHYRQAFECVQHDLLAIAPGADLFADVDYVVHLAAYASAAGISAKDLTALNVDAALAMARLAQQSQVKRFIFLSSSQVVAITGSINGSESIYANDSYALSKLAAEQALQAQCQHTASSMQLVIVRPPLVYGPGVKGNFARLQQAVAKGRWLPLGALQHNKRSYLALANLTDFIQLCLTHPQAAAQPWQISDNSDISTRQLISNIARAQAKPARLLPVQLWLLGAIGKLTGNSAAVQRLTAGMQLDISAAQQQLGWQPKITMAQQLALMLPSASAE